MLVCKAEESHTILRGGVRFCGLNSKQVSPEYESESLWIEPACALLLLLLLLLLCRRNVVFCQTLSASDMNSCSSSQCALCPPHYTLELFSSPCSCFSSFITAIGLWCLRHYWCCLPYWIGLISLFVSDVLPRSQWCDFVVSGCQRSEFRCVPSILPWLFFLSKLITYCYRHPLPHFIYRYNTDASF